MERRDFLKSAAAAAGAVALERAASPLFAGPSRPDLAVAHGPDAAKTARAAVEAMGGMKAFVSRGDVVVVKPNIGWDRRPEQAADTNPEVVAALVAMCLEAGAKKVKVFDRTCNDPRRCYVQSGIEAAAKAAGAEVSHIDDRLFKDVAIPGGMAITSWPLYTEILEADKVINVPIAKHHSLAGLTLSFKNWMGVMGGSRGRIHQNVNESLLDLSLVIKPTLTVLDAVRILTAHGPQGGDLEDVKRLDTVVAGVNQVCVDAYGATLFGKAPESLGVVAAAHRRGMGPVDPAKMVIRKVEA
jgi:uncharacterized protein (DUF362 family)